MYDSAANASSKQSEMPSRLGHSTNSSMSLASGSTLLDDQDEDVRIAVKALGDMRSGNIGGTSKISTTSSATPALSISGSSIPATSVPSPTLSSFSEVQAESDFVSRVSHIPLVNGALRMYEQGKASSRVVKYGAEIMESGVKTISKPVINRLPTGQLDDFACRQLDRLDKYRRSSHGASDDQDGDSARRAFRSPPSDRDSEAYGRGDDVDRWLESTSSSRSDDSRSSTPTHSLYSQVIQDADSDSVYPTAGSSGSGRSHTHSSHYQSHHRHQQPPESQNQQVVHRSRWQSIILEAGGFGAAWSEESMRRLRYVLQWLQYATDHIDQQILAIRDFTESLQQNYFDPSTAEGSPTTPTNNKRSSANHTRSSSVSVRGGHSRSESESESQAISSVHMHKLASLRRDVVHTVREVVSVVSKYGGSAAMPEPARNAVKGFILKLPKKVGDAMRMGASSTDIPSAPVAPSGGVVGVSGPERDSVAFAASGRPGIDRRRRTRGDRGVGGSNSAAQSPSISRAPSPSNSPRVPADPSISGMDEDQSSSGSGFRHGPPLHTMSAGSAAATAQRILTLATESLDMMRGMTAVVKDSLDRADAWVERLKRVGVQRGDGEPDASGSQLPPAPPASTSEHGRLNLTLSPNMMQYREQEQDVASLSPLNMTFNPNSRSRRGSVGSSTGYSLPSTPGLGYLPGSNKYVPSHGPGAPVVDAPSPEMGLGLRRMSIRGDDAEEPVNIKKEEPEETKMEIDEPQ